MQVATLKGYVYVSFRIIRSNTPRCSVSPRYNYRLSCVGIMQPLYRPTIHPRRAYRFEVNSVLDYIGRFVQHNLLLRSERNTLVHRNVRPAYHKPPKGGNPFRSVVNILGWRRRRTRYPRIHIVKRSHYAVPRNEWIGCRYRKRSKSYRLPRRKPNPTVRAYVSLRVFVSPKAKRKANRNYATNSIVNQRYQCPR